MGGRTGAQAEKCREEDCGEDPSDLEVQGVRKGKGGEVKRITYDGEADDGGR